MVKSKLKQNKERIQYLKRILERVNELNAKADHLITVFRERYYTPFNCPYANFKYVTDLFNGKNNGGSNNNDNED